MVVARAGYHGQVAAFLAFQPALAVYHQGQFGGGKAVDDGNRVHAHERFEFRVQYRAVHVVTVGIGAVEDEARLAVFGAGFHDVVHRAGVGVVAHAHVLNVEDHDVDVPQLFRRGFFVLAVKRHNGQSGLGIFAVLDRGPGVGLAPEAVFGSKNGLDFHTQSQQTVGQMDAVGK